MLTCFTFGTCAILTEAKYISINTKRKWVALPASSTYVLPSAHSCIWWSHVDTECKGICFSEIINRCIWMPRNSYILCRKYGVCASVWCTDQNLHLVDAAYNQLHSPRTTLKGLTVQNLVVYVRRCAKHTIISLCETISLSHLNVHLKQSGF